jgi:hypothetical protein
MGNSPPPPAEFDLVDSFARLRGDDVEIVLAEPKTDIAADGASLRLQKSGPSVSAPAQLVESGGRRLTARVPRGRLGNGIWSLAVVHADGSVAPLAARLLVQGPRPVVLLWGAEAGPTEEPRRRGSTGGRSGAVHAGGRVLDRALAPLPDAQAERIRRGIRRAARRILK